MKTIQRISRAMIALILCALALSTVSAGCAPAEGLDKPGEPEPVGTASSASVTTTVTIQRGMPGSTVEDTYVNDDSFYGYNRTNYGTVDPLQFGNQIGNNVALFLFDLSAIPPHAIVDSATLGLALAFDNAVAGAEPILYRVTLPWSESAVTWQNFGSGYAQSPPIATLPSVQVIPPFEHPFHFSVNVTSMVQAWVDRTSPSYGFAVATSPTATMFSGGTLASSEDPSPANRPSLTVTYTTTPCSFAANGTACDDNNACTTSDTCQNGACVGSNPVVCPGSGQCSTTTCNPLTGLCSVADGTPCNDGNACTQTDSCKSGLCVGSNPVVCTPADACHLPAVCAPATGTCPVGPAITADIAGGLVHRWAFDEPSGPALDSVGTVNGTLGASASRTLSFNGSSAVSLTPTSTKDPGSYVTFPTVLDPAGVYTVSVWFNAPAPPLGRAYLFNADYGNVWGGGDNAQLQGTALEMVVNAGNDDFMGASTTKLADGTWHHLSFTRSTTGFDAYVDGLAAVQQGAGPGTEALTEVSLGSSPQGHVFGDQALRMSFADLRVYDRALTACDALALSKNIITNGTLSGAADEWMRVYQNGTLVLDNPANLVGLVHTATVDVGFGDQLAVEAGPATNAGGKSSFVAQLVWGTSTFSTDTLDWRCTSTTPPSGWMSPTFNDSAWPFAVVGANGALGGGVLQAKGAVPIWGSGAAAATVYCRAKTSAIAHSCEDVKNQGGGITDGNYVIDIAGQPVTVYCKGMAGAPLEYLTLVNTSTGANYSNYAIGPNSATGLTTKFTKVRFHPVNLTVDVTDLTFSSSQGSYMSGPLTFSTVPYAWAGDCSTASVTGTGNVDLTGTPFTVVPNQFTAQGYFPSGTAVYSAGGQVVNLTGAGDCGAETVTGNFLQLQLGVCGDGIIEPGEQCDDGNAQDGDGCSNTCQDECSTLAFAGSTFATAANPTTLNATSATLAAWFQFPVGDGGTIAEKKGNIYGGHITYGVAATPSGLTARFQTNVNLAFLDLSDPTFAPDGKWHHVAATYDAATGNGALFLDGQVVASGTLSTGLVAADPTQPFVIGADVFQGAVGYVTGNIADVVIYGTALSLAQVAGLVHGKYPSGPLAFFPVEEGTGTTSADLSGNGHTLTVPAGGWASGGPFCATAVCGDGIVQPGEQCDDGNTQDGDGCSSTCQLECSTLAFAGSTMVSAANPTSLAPSSVTVAAWYDFPLHDGGVIVDKMGGAQGGVVYGLAATTQGLIGAFTVSPTLTIDLVSGVGAPDGKWHQAAITYDAATGKAALFLDGAQVATGSGGSGLVPADPTQPFVIGAELFEGAYYGYATGEISDVVVYGTALSAAQVAALFKGKYPPGPLAFFPVEEGTGTTSADVSGNGHTLTVPAGDWATGGPFCKLPGQCGNGELDPGEQCDLGAKNSDNVLSACSTSCTKTGLLALFEAANVNGNGSALVDGAPVATWVDTAGGNNAVQTTATQQPIYRASAVNGKPALQFDGVNDVLFSPLDIDYTVLPTVTVVAIFQNVAGGPAPYDGVWGQDTGGFCRFLISGGGGPEGTGISSGSNVTPVPNLTAVGVPIISAAVLNNGAGPGTSIVYVNGTPAVSFAESHPVSGASQLSIGNIKGPPENPIGAFSGYISLIAVFNRALTSAEIQQL